MLAVALQCGLKVSGWKHVLHRENRFSYLLHHTRWRKIQTHDLAVNSGVLI